MIPLLSAFPIDSTGVPQTLEFISSTVWLLDSWLATGLDLYFGAFCLAVRTFLFHSFQPWCFPKTGSVFPRFPEVF